MDAAQQNDIRSRVAGRKLAIDGAMLLMPDVELLGPTGRKAFWEHMGELAKKYLESTEPRQPDVGKDSDSAMNDAQARAFGAVQIRFGKYRGRQVDEVPLGYLAMLVDDNTFKKQVRRYLASPRIRRELEQAGSEWEE